MTMGVFTLRGWGERRAFAAALPSSEIPSNASASVGRRCSGVIRILDGIGSATVRLGGARGAAIPFERNEASSAVCCGFAFSASARVVAALFLRGELLLLGGTGRLVFADITPKPQP